MKIAFLSFYSGKVARGVETFVHELANRLVSLGNDVTVFQWGDRLPGADYETVVIKIKMDWTKKGSYVPFLNYYSLKVKKFTTEVLKRLDKDTQIIFPTNGQWQSLLCSLWARYRNKKIVISGQSGPGIDDRINLFTFPDSFVGLTKHQQNWAKGANILTNVQKIPNGVDLKKFKDAGNGVDLKLSRPIILCVSAFDKWKRVDLVIKSVSKLKEGSLILVGRGPEESNLRKLGDRLLPDRFKIMCFEHKDMPAVYKSADLFTFSTVPWESFGIVLVEAMASGLPVVATDDPIRREIVGDAGILVDPTDTAKYAEALEAALAKNWGNKPRTQAEKFSWDKIAEDYNRLFKNI